MRGQHVIVRTFGSKPRAARLWDVDGDVVYICSDENFAQLEAGLEALWPVAFPHDAVFVYDPDLLESFGENPSDFAVLWSQLRPWSDTGGSKATHDEVKALEGGQQERLVIPTRKQLKVEERI